MKGPGSQPGGRWGWLLRSWGPSRCPHALLLALFLCFLGDPHITRQGTLLSGCLLPHAPWAVRGAVEICGRIPSSLIFVFVPALRVHNVKWMPEWIDARRIGWWAHVCPTRCRDRVSTGVPWTTPARVVVGSAFSLPRLWAWPLGERVASESQKVTRAVTASDFHFILLFSSRQVRSSLEF